jgi:RNA polymerase sigma factor (sigma-70 family)
MAISGQNDIMELSLPHPASGASGPASPRVLRLASDDRLVALIRNGNRGAFEAAYDRHHRALLSFCRQMLGSREDAEDAVQHTFLAAHAAIERTSERTNLRAWLFTIARNRCLDMLRARREVPVDELAEASTEGLAAVVERRADLRELLADVAALPERRRAALVLSELGALSHAEIGEVVGVPGVHVRTLVFQARQSLAASRQARAAPCTDVRVELSTVSGAALRRAPLRRHLEGCPACRGYRDEVRRQRRAMAVLLPVVPSAALKSRVLDGLAGGGGGSGLAGSGAAGGLAKSAALVAVVGGGAVATVIAVHPGHPAGSARAAEGPAPSVQIAPPTAAVPNPIATAALPPVQAAASEAVASSRAAGGRSAAGHRAGEHRRYPAPGAAGHHGGSTTAPGRSGAATRPGAGARAHGNGGAGGLQAGGGRPQHSATRAPGGGGASGSSGGGSGGHAAPTPAVRGGAPAPGRAAPPPPASIPGPAPPPATGGHARGGPGSSTGRGHAATPVHGGGRIDPGINARGRALGNAGTGPRGVAHQTPGPPPGPPPHP